MCLTLLCVFFFAVLAVVFEKTWGKKRVPTHPLICSYKEAGMSFALNLFIRDLEMCSMVGFIPFLHVHLNLDLQSLFKTSLSGIYVHRGTVSTSSPNNYYKS